MAVVFLLIAGLVLPHFRPPVPTAHGVPALGDWISFGGVVFGAAIGWSSYAADYTAHQPEEASRTRIFALTFAGVALPCALLQFLGVAITGAGYPPAAFAGGGGAYVAVVLGPLGLLGSVLLAVLAFGMVANNIPNDYSLGLSMQVLGRRFQKVPRPLWTLLGAVSYVTIALFANGHFDALLTNFLLVMAYWLGPWSVILWLEHALRRGRYDPEAWNDPRRLPSGGAALAAMAAGFVGVALGASQAFFTGPLARYTLNSDRLSPIAREAAASAGLGPVCRNPYRSIMVRCIEVLYACDEALRIITAYEPPPRCTVPLEPRAARACAATEAPRGLLYHRYTLDGDGIIQAARIVAPTSQNQGSIEADLAEFLRGHLSLPQFELRQHCEHLVRNHDPCISCAAHFLKLEVLSR
jgi:hypothetical protein